MNHLTLLYNDLYIDRNCNLNAIELILEHGADLSHRDMYNRSFLHWAAYTGKV